ncbi:predicted protein [Naegleria gruberi]|uniref:Predicted protein n=1 Tax=Naegleria gruberi TaxID=5762 RepID=D2VNP4_NAEGR|nr:uncharacterized protein NAEGRDRAFT_80662 [Naegleria gruberi]EFC41538.1 predicted protein [Naegleria gruberi]|eukprot:XP_002674282.1 predicted protein [Naegleria gruberi strain NEG-M]
MKVFQVACHILLLLACLCMLVTTVHTQTPPNVKYSVSTFAGGNSQLFQQRFGDGFESSMSCLSYIKDIIPTKDGSMYIADASMAAIRKIDNNGIISLVAGNYRKTIPGDGSALSVSVISPFSMVLTQDETIMYIAQGNGCIRKLDIKNGNISTLVGVCGTANFSGDGTSDLNSIRLNNPLGVELSPDETILFIADYGNNRVRQFNISSGFIETIYGGSGYQAQDVLVNGDLLYISEGQNGKVSLMNWRNRTILSPIISSPFFFDKMFKQDNNLYVNALTSIFKYDLSGGSTSQTLLPVIKASSAFFDLNGKLIVAEEQKYIYKFDLTNGTKTTIAGNCKSKIFIGYSSDNQTSVKSTTMYVGTSLIAASRTKPGVLYGLDFERYFLHKFESGYSSIIGGDGRSDDFAALSIGLPAANSSLGVLFGAIDEWNGEVYYAVPSLIMKIDKITGNYVVVVGTTSTSASGYGDGGPLSNAGFGSIADIAIYENKIYVADLGTIRLVDLSSQTISMYFNSTTFKAERLAVDPTDGCIVFYFPSNCTINKILNDGTLITLVGNGTCAIWDTSSNSVIAIQSPLTSLADFFYLSNGDLILSHSRSSIRMLKKSSGFITNIAGTFGVSGYKDGKTSLFSFRLNSLAVDRNDNSIYISDNGNLAIRKLTPYCDDGWILSGNSTDCSPDISIKFDNTITFVDSTVLIAVKYHSNLKSYLTSATYTVLFSNNGVYTNIGNPTIVSTANPMIVSYSLNSEGNFTAVLRISFGGISYSFKTAETIQVMKYENVVTESFLGSISTKDIASIASNSDTYSKASSAVSVLTMVTQALSTVQRNTSDLDQTLKVSTALNVISSQSSVTTSIVSTVSNLISTISSELNQLEVSTLKSSNAIDTTISQVLNAYSNVIVSSNYSSSSVIETLILVSSKSSDEKDSIFKTETPSFIVSVVRNLNSSSYLNDGNTTISTPSDLVREGVSVGSITYFNMEKLASLYSNATELTSNLTDASIISKVSKGSSVNIAKVVELKYILNGQFLQVSNLANPIILSLNVDSKILSSVQNNSSLVVSCKFFDETSKKWLTDGCISEISKNSSVVNCYCNHTTSFSSFIDVKVTLANEGGVIASIVIGCFLIFLTLIALVGVIVTCKKTPTKSRGIIPYFALISLLIELVFTYIIANSLSLAKNPNSMIVRQVSTMIASTFYCLSILNYLILSSRYIVFRYLYEIMAIFDEKEVDVLNEKKFKWIKLLFSSKTFSIIANLIVACVFIAFYVIFISLQQTAVISSSQYASIMAGSLFSFVLVMSLLVCVIHFFDIYMELRYVQLSTKLTLKDKKLVINPIKNYLIVNDNLAFRKEFIFFFTSIIFFIITYGLGFSLLVASNQGLSAAQIAFELLYNIMLIMSFGGLVSLVSIYELVKSKISGKHTKMKEESILEEDNQLNEILKNPTLCEIFKQFAKTEHSLENVIFWTKLAPVFESINNGNTPATTELCKHFEEWKATFIENNSPMELNISHNTKKSFHKIFESVRNNQQNDKEIKEVLSDLYCAIIMNIDDTFSRFVLSDSYESMNKKIELKENLGSTLKLKE